MRTRRPSPDHQAAVSRRLAQLGAELSSSRLMAADEPPAAPGPAAPGGGSTGDWWAGHTRVARAGRLLDEAPAAPQAPLPPAPPPPAPAPLGPAPPDPIRDESGAASVVPVPGRHAARRGAALGRLVPEPLRGRAALGPGPVAVVAVLVALGLAVTCWWVVRSAPGEPAGRLAAAPTGGLLATPAARTEADPGGAGAQLPGGAGTVSGTGTGATSGDGAGTGTVTVDVAGRVRRPGIAVLPAGSRVVDALEAAGGARRGVQLTGLNLARVLVDGEQVLVGRPAPAAGAGTGVAPPAGAASGALVNVNLASQAELELLPDVGPVTAQAIIAWREEHGGFTAVEELLEVDGIGDATLATLAPHVTV